MIKKKRVLITGGTGFIGQFVLNALKDSDYFHPVVAVRNDSGIEGLESYGLGSFDAATDWSVALADVDVVIHCAARAHVVKENAIDSMTIYRTVNRDVTVNLAMQAAAKGVKRFIFLSSIGVNGNHTGALPFRPEDTPSPTEPYAITKAEAEQALKYVQQKTGMEVVIVRPPLVYGPNAPGNFGLLIRAVQNGLPLPLGDVENRRTLVSVWNLVDLIRVCIDHPAAANQVFLAGDGQDVSTTELLRGVGRAMGKPARLIPVPAGMLMFGAGLLGKKAVAQRLLGSLQVDISKARNLLGWEPPLSVEEGLRRCFDSENEC